MNGIPDPLRSVVTVETDEHGRFEILHVKNGKYDLMAEAEGYSVNSIRAIEIDASLGEIDIGAIELDPAASLRGRVVNRRGQPLEGVEVRPMLQTWAMRSEWMVQGRRGRSQSVGGSSAEAGVVSDERGYFEVSNLEGGSLVTLWLTRRGLLEEQFSGIPVPPEERLVLRMMRSASLKGRVVRTPGGEPVSARIELVPEVRESGRPGGGSMNGSEFHYTDIAPGAYRLRATTAEGESAARALVLEEAEAREIELVLDQERGPGRARIEGRVIDGSGQGMEARLFVVSAGDNSSQHHTQSNLSGEFSFDDVEPGPTFVIAVREGLGLVNERKQTRIDAVAGLNEVEILFEGFVLAGRVVDEAGEPVVGATILIPGERASATSGPSGEFRFESISAGEVFLSVQSESLISLENVRFELAGDLEGVEIGLKRGGVVRGHILGIEIEELTQIMVTAAAGGRFPTFVGGDGRYEIRGLRPGENTIQATHLGSMRTVQAVAQVTAPGSVEVDLIFEEGWVLTGRLWSGDEPLPGALLQIRGASGSFYLQATTDYRGGFRFDDVPSGRFQFMVPGALGVARTPFSGQELSIDADLDLGDVILQGNGAVP